MLQLFWRYKIFWTYYAGNLKVFWKYDEGFQNVFESHYEVFSKCFCMRVEGILKVIWSHFHNVLKIISAFWTQINKIWQPKISSTRAHTQAHANTNKISGADSELSCFPEFGNGVRTTHPWFPCLFSLKTCLAFSKSFFHGIWSFLKLCQRGHYPVKKLFKGILSKSVWTFFYRQMLQSKHILKY